MAELVADRAVPVDRLEKGRGRRHLNVIGARNVGGSIASDAQIGAGCADQPLGLRQDEVFGTRRRRRREIGRKIRALVTVENREALEERDRFGFVPASAARERSR
jgi:hypothetical protein